MDDKIRTILRAAGICLVGILIGMMSIFFYNRMTTTPVSVIRAENLTDVIQDLQDSYNSFKGMSGDQLHDVWNQLFFDSVYKIDGKVRKDEYDCGGAETTFWRTLGANVVYESTEMKELRLQRTSKKHKSIKSVSVGDIIIFKRKEKYGHIAVIERVDKTTLRYMDLNVKEDGQGFNIITFYDTRIQGIYRMTFDYWCGDILNKYDRKKERTE